MNDHRPNPDLLLARVREEEAKEKTGALKIFFGFAPGVGKTFAMLESAHHERKNGIDVVIGYVEPHARPETQALIAGLEVIPPRGIEYRGTAFFEFDLEAALARRPRLILVDELAHTNIAGMTHEKRWQDIRELLHAGINVYTTLNVQHIESLNDIVSQITGVQVKETIPDSVFDQAADVELIDLPADELLQRLKDGKIYLQFVAEKAVENFFKKGHLIALRELALRRTAERVNAQMERYREHYEITGTWATSERLLVCVGPSPLSARLVRATCRMAAGFKAPWIAVHVETPQSKSAGPRDRNRLLHNLQLASQLGGETVTLSAVRPIDEVLRYARSRNVTKIIVGKPTQPRWRDLLFGSFVYELTRSSGAIDVYVITGEGDRRARETIRTVLQTKLPVKNYLWASVTVAACTLLSQLVFAEFAAVNVAMVYLVGVLIASLWLGQGPAILSSVAGVIAFDVFFVPPYFTLSVQDSEYLITFAVMLATGLVISTLTSRLRLYADSATARERQTSALYSLSRALGESSGVPEIAKTVATTLQAVLNAEVQVLLSAAEEEGRLVMAYPIGSTLTSREFAVAKWVQENQELAGFGTTTLPAAEALYVPIVKASLTFGVLAVRPSGRERLFESEQLRLIDTFAAQTATELEKATIAKESGRVRLEVQSERLRNALLSAVSHDLRTPISAIVGASTTLLDAAELTDAAKNELLAYICEEAQQLDWLIGNLLEATRLEAGGVALAKEWQSLEELLGVVLNRTGNRFPADRVVVTLPEDLPLVHAEGTLLRQVLLNLLENAAKYSAEGTPITVTARAGARVLIVEVADCGRGFTPGDEEKVFEKFFRSGENDRRGVGLGLTICKGIIELHGGTITARNRPEGGAIVSFTLPLSESQPSIEEEQHAAPDKGLG